ncbi:MAG: acylphosphatase [Thermogutta sp.]|nr:acylphosphatase [Thermogutta sp.]
MERREIYYSGRVQGVGFRYTTLQIAAGFNVTGYVENLADGRVHLVAEGPSEELDQFTRAVSARLAYHIRTTEESRGPATGRFSGFTIRG